jgi:hypothetical protein
MRTLLCLPILFVLGCTSSWTIDTAQVALTSGAEVVQALDETIAPALESAAETADRETETQEAFLLRMQPWEPVVVGLTLTRQSFRAAQRGLDAWRAGSDAQWLNAAACVLLGLVELERALPIVNVQVPAEITRWLGLFRGYAVSACVP